MSGGLMSHASTEDRLLGAGTVELPRVDLLPPEIAEGRRFRRVQAGMGLGVLAAVAAVAALYVGATGGVADAQEQVQAASTEQARITTESAAFSDVTTVYAQAAAAEEMLTQAMGAEVRSSRLLSDLSLLVPEKVWVTEMGFTQATEGAAAVPSPTGAIGVITFSGFAYQHDDVAVWLEALQAREDFGEVTLTSATEELIGEKTFVKWSSTVDLGPLALSGRYKPLGG